MEHFAIVGFGCAGYQALRAIRQSRKEISVDVFSETDLPPYNPMLTTYYVKEKIPYQAMFPFGTLEEIIQQYPCNYFGNTKVEALDVDKKTITVNGQIEKRYDKILIATGAGAVSLPVGNFPENRIYTMRTAADAVRFREDLDKLQIKKALVVGASMVGIKIVELLKERGIEVVLSDLADHIFPTAAFPETSARIENYLHTEGIETRFGVKTETADFYDNRGYITFSDGSSLDADIVVMCVGTYVACRWLDSSKININRAIVVNQYMQTSAEGIYAAGDCCEAMDLMLHDTRNIGLYANAFVQGRIAGLHMTDQSGSYGGNILHNITHFMDIDFVSFGDKNLSGERMVFLDEDDKYIEATVKNDALQCINMLNTYEFSGVIKNYMINHLLDKKEPLDELEKGILVKSGFPDKLFRLLERMAL